MPYWVGETYLWIAIAVAIIASIGGIVWLSDEEDFIMVVILGLTLIPIMCVLVGAAWPLTIIIGGIYLAVNR